ncbi:MAG: energy-coupling factor transporter transmembrane component T [Candidatus Bathyarchaeia archaeon]
MKRSLLGYLPIESPIFSTHPLTRLLFLLVVSAYPMFVELPELNVVGTLFMLYMFIYGKVDIRIIKNYKLAFINLLFVIMIAYTFFGGYVPGYRVLATLGPIKISWENIRWAIMVYIRLIFAILIIIFFLSTTRERDVIVGLRSLKLPFAVCYIAGLSLRSIGMSLIDFNTIREAEKARALNISELPFKEKIKKFGLYIVPLVALAIRRSDEVSNALDSRGFKISGKGRTDYIITRYRYKKFDYVAIVAMILFLLMLFIVNFRYGYFLAKNSLLYRL